MSGFCVASFDPGISGAMAFHFPAYPNMVSVEDFPIVDGEIDAAQLADRLRQIRPDVAIIEHVWARPNDGKSVAFKFGNACGTLKGVLAALAIPHHRVTPGVWKKHFNLSADKEESRALAIRLWPASEHFRRKKDHGRAEAALIGRFFVEKHPQLIPIVNAESNGSSVA